MPNEDNITEEVMDDSIEDADNTDEIMRLSEELKAVTQEFNNAMRAEVENQDRKTEDPEALLDELE